MMKLWIEYAYKCMKYNINMWWEKKEEMNKYKCSSKFFQQTNFLNFCAMKLDLF